MAEMTEAAHLDAREVREPVTPEVTGPVRVPEFPLSGDVDVATINAATDAFINGMVQAVGEENDPRVKKTFQMWTVMGKLVTSNARLLSHHLEQMNEKLDGLTEWMKKDCESGQSCFEETRVTMAEFAKKFDVLSESIKFMSATSKTSAHDEAEVKKKMMLELANSREVLSHIRGNTGTTNKKIGDLLWICRHPFLHAGFSFRSCSLMGTTCHRIEILDPLFRYRIRSLHFFPFLYHQTLLRINTTFNSFSKVC